MTKRENKLNVWPSDTFGTWTVTLYPTTIIVYEKPNAKDIVIVRDDNLIILWFIDRILLEMRDSLVTWRIAYTDIAWIIFNTEKTIPATTEFSN